jgi:hypothetical protein
MIDARHSRIGTPSWGVEGSRAPRLRKISHLGMCVFPLHNPSQRQTFHVLKQKKSQAVSYNLRPSMIAKCGLFDIKPRVIAPHSSRTALPSSPNHCPSCLQSRRILLSSCATTKNVQRIFDPSAFADASLAASPSPAEPQPVPTALPPHPVSGDRFRFRLQDSSDDRRMSTCSKFGAAPIYCLHFCGRPTLQFGLLVHVITSTVNNTTTPIPIQALPVGPP